MGNIVSSREIGFKIKQLRQKAGLSQEKLSEKIGVTFQQVQKYESGHTTLNILKLQQIAVALQVPVSEFFKAEHRHQVTITNEEDSLLQVYRRIKSNELKRCIHTLVGNLNRRVK